MVQEMLLRLQLSGLVWNRGELDLPQHLGGKAQADGFYAVACNSILPLTNKLTSAQVTNSRCAFFFSPR